MGGSERDVFKRSERTDDKVGQGEGGRGWSGEGWLSGRGGSWERVYLPPVHSSMSRSIWPSFPKHRLGSLIELTNLLLFIFPRLLFRLMYRELKCSPVAAIGLRTHLPRRL